MDSSKLSSLAEAILAAGVEEEADLSWVSEDMLSSCCHQFKPES